MHIDDSLCHLQSASITFLPNRLLTFGGNVHVFFKEIKIFIYITKKRFFPWLSSFPRLADVYYRYLDQTFTARISVGWNDVVYYNVFKRDICIYKRLAANCMVCIPVQWRLKYIKKLLTFFFALNITRSAHKMFIDHSHTHRMNTRPPKKPPRAGLATSVGRNNKWR